MFFSRMKPLPRAIIFGLAVGGAIFAYKTFVPPAAPKVIEPPAVAVVQVPAEAAQPAAIAQPVHATAPTAPPADEPIKLTPAGSSGLDAVLKAGGK